VAGIGAGQVEAKELDSPLARGAGEISGSIPVTGTAAAEGFVSGREKAEKGGGASCMGNEGPDIVRMVTMGVSVMGGGGGGEPKSNRWARGPSPPRWSKVVGRRSILWATRDWTMEELAGVEPPRNFFRSAR
jgi:hypothetical protein